MEIQNHNDPQIIFVHFILAISFGCLVLMGLKKSIEIPQKCFLFVKTGIKCDIRCKSSSTAAFRSFEEISNIKKKSKLLANTLVDLV